MFSSSHAFDMKEKSKEIKGIPSKTNTGFGPGQLLIYTSVDGTCFFSFYSKRVVHNWIL